MAGVLHISERTVHSHIHSILAKLNVHSRAEAIAYLYQSSIYVPPDKSREVGG
ncbi:helix-turn-helix transcriptional regulator [Chloroflexia bacterium SDU3-3]|nr:helix-turn-helix transcriptional regulator [Chloroflexia bacterium SDU3-3]